LLALYHAGRLPEHEGAVSMDIRLNERLWVMNNKSYICR
jgi:hypothetical protein